jgi:hypothetical protein
MRDEIWKLKFGVAARGCEKVEPSAAIDLRPNRKPLCGQKNRVLIVLDSLKTENLRGHRRRDAKKNPGQAEDVNALAKVSNQLKN